MKKEFIFVFFIAIFGLFLRVYTINWDYGFHLHPDERAIVLYTLPLAFPATFTQFFSPSSSLNPHFFAYGSFPLYFLKLVGYFISFINPFYATYDGLTILGRCISAIFDSSTIVVLFFLIKKLAKGKIALVSSLLYAFCVLPIQLGHFYAVDTLLTFFITLLLYIQVLFFQHPTKKKAIFIGILFGFALATKISALVLLITIGLTISLEFLLIFLKSPHKPQHWFPHLPKFLKRLGIEGLLLFLTIICTFFILEPYAFISFPEFLTQSLQQSEMTKNAFIFPYTLQYVGKIPYVYEIQNSLFWGMGPFLGFFAWIGFLFLLFTNYTAEPIEKQKRYLVLSFFIVYFLLVGHFAIGFMRYLLPVYPLLCFFAANFLYNIFIFVKIHYKIVFYPIISIAAFLFCIWPLSFMNIYIHPPTRVSASDWIQQHIPAGKTLAIEHWDDALPLTGQQAYTMTTLELYNPDSAEKWQKITAQLKTADYIIIASNRLYIPLQKLTDCNRLPIQYCYTQTAAYYKNLFNGSLGFTKVAEFSVYPEIPFLHTPINDQSADESFTVYDHPKVMIFRKNNTK